MSEKNEGPGGWKGLFQQVEVVAAIIGVIGTIVGTLLVSVLLSFLEGRLGLGSVVGLVVFMLLAGIWILLAIRWGVRLAAAAAAIMMILGSALFLISQVGVPGLGSRARSAAVSPEPVVPATLAPAVDLAQTPPPAPASPTPSVVSTLPPATATIVPVPQAVASPTATPFTPGTGWTSFSNANRVRVLTLQGDDLWAGGDGGLVRWNIQDGTYEKYTVDNGLVSNDVTALTVDHGGLLWVGTSSGISRFDGTGWENWTRKTGLPGEDVAGLAPDGQGGMWIGFDGLGVSHFQSGVGWIDAWQTFGPAEGLPGDTLGAVALDGQGRLWVSVYSVGIGRFDPAGSAWELFGEIGIDADYSRPLMESQQGDLWVSGIQALAHLDGEAGDWQTLALAEELPEVAVASILEDRDGNLWIGTWNDGVARYDGSRWVHLREEDGLIDDTVLDIVQDDAGNLWFATLSGISRLDPERGTWQAFTTTDILPSNEITDIAQDENGVLWFGHPAWGLSRLDLASGHWSVVGEEGDIDSVRSLAVDQAGGVWVGSWYGAKRFDGKAWTSFTAEDGFPVNGVVSLASAPDGALWLGTEVGVSHYDPRIDAWQSFGESDGLPAGEAYILHAGNDGLVWVYASDADSLVVFDGTVWGPPPGDAEVLRSIHDVAQSPDGVLWAAAGSLLRFEDGDWQAIPDPERAWIDTLAVAPDGIVWTNGHGIGVRRYDPTTGQWQSLTTADGLASVEVTTIFVDQQGAVWVGTEAGLSRWGGG